MPISKEKKKLYPKNWKEIRATIIGRADDSCELCGIRNNMLVWRYRFNQARWNVDKGLAELYPTTFKSPIKSVLTIAHINQDPTDNRDYNLLALCQRCHNKIDMPYRVDNRKKGKE